MQITSPHELPKLLGRNAYIVYSLLCFAEMEHIAPVGRQWLMDNMPGPVSPYTVSQALHILTSPECQFAVRVHGGWRAAGKAFQLPLAYLTDDEDPESPNDSLHTTFSRSTGDSLDRSGGGAQKGLLPCAPPPAGGKKAPEKPKDSERPFRGGGGDLSLSLSTISPPPPPYTRKKAAESPKDSESTDSPHIRACLDTLREYGVFGRKARELSQLEWVTPEYIRAHMEQTQAEAGNLKSPVGLAVYRIQEGAPLPKKRRTNDDDDDRSKYIKGKYAHIIKH